MIRLLFFDIDGTLFDDHHLLPASVQPALQAARDNGCRIFLNTGRTLCNLDPRLDSLPLDGMILGCGTRILCQGRTLQALEYAPEDSFRIREIINRCGIPAVYECDTAMYFDPQGVPYPVIRHFRAFSDNVGISREIRPGDPDFRAVKMFTFSESPDPIRRMISALREAGYPYEAIDRGGAGWEVVPASCSKALGIERVRQELDVPLSSCYAFGDSTNDLPMLTHVPHSVAMGNAPEEVQRQCAFVTDRPEDDGIRNALRHLDLI